jgi:hypothetical protein
VRLVGSPTLPLLALLLLAGCQQEMSRQPYYRPLEPSSFFADDRSARPLLPGTIPWTPEADDPALSTGKTGITPEVIQATANLGLGVGSILPAVAPTLPALPNVEYVREFPFRVTEEVLQRGRERFSIYCAVCHDAMGTGHGKIVERGYYPPPSFQTDYSRGLERRGIKVLLRDVPVGYYFEVITHGYGAMPDYSTQVPAVDRWKIIAYIRALQLSQHARIADLPEKERDLALKALEAKP